MAENVETLQSGYEAFARGDLDAALENFHDDVRWENPNAPQLPNAGTHEGKDAVKQVLASTADQGDDFRVAPDEFLDAGEVVVVLGHLEGKGKETGKHVKSPFVHVWRMSDGKAKRVQLLWDTALTVEALGSSAGSSGSEGSDEG